MVNDYETGDKYLANGSKESGYKVKAVCSKRKEHLNNISNINKPTSQSQSECLLLLLKLS